MSSVDTEDEELLGLLRAEVDGQAPPPVRTALDDVVRRGRRRIRTRRIGATLGVVVVVAGIGIATSLLRGMPGRGLPASQINAASSSVSTTPSGWAVASSPSSSTRDSKDCSSGISVPGDPQIGVISVDRLNSTLISALQQVAPKASSKITSSTIAKLGSGNPLLASTWADVIDSGGGGSVYVEVHGFSGSPEQAADNDQFIGGDCTPPMRKSFPGGVVMQLYPAEKYDPGHPSQALSVYTPAHVQYVITAEGFSSADWTHDPSAKPDTLVVPEGAGRHSLPLNESQLIAIGEHIAPLG